jgi:hypothetical protein
MWFRRQRKLAPRTVVLIDRLFSVPWFTRVGEPIGENIRAVNSWSAAIEYVKDPDQVFLEVSGDYTVNLHKTAPKDYQRWNKIADLLVGQLEPRIEERIDRLPLDRTLLKPVRDRARWSLLHACIESEYLDVVPAGFYLPLSDWYMKGRFPCGWEGRYPAGMLAVY